MNVNYQHIPVLTEQLLDQLQVKVGGSYIDCTAGAGGHSRAILEASSPSGRVLAVDLDPIALEKAQENLMGFPGQVMFENDNFRNLTEVAWRHQFDAVDGILFDLGLSSMQLMAPDRGFSFKSNGPLDMRFNPAQQQITAWDIVNNYSEEELSRVISTYGEERQAKNIAKRVLSNRPINDSSYLAKIVSGAVRGKWGSIHPATRTFQAIRIEVNRELDNISSALGQAIALLKLGGRLAIISYHSLEDRIVKQIFKQESKEECSIRLVNKKIISPSREEVLANRSSRSARMRVAERI